MYIGFICNFLQMPHKTFKYRGIYKYKNNLRRKNMEVGMCVKAEKSFFVLKLCRRNSCPVSKSMGDFEHIHFLTQLKLPLFQHSE